MGIVNGTTNFILTKMAQDGMEFEEALALATELGYAEADPTADIEGLDAGRKVAIMASIAFNSRVTFDDVYTEGITKITGIRYPLCKRNRQRDQTSRRGTQHTGRNRSTRPSDADPGKTSTGIRQ